MLTTVLVLGVPLAVVSGYLVTQGITASVEVRAESIAAALSEQVAAHETVNLTRVASAVPAGWRLEYRTSDGDTEIIGAAADDDMISATLPVVNNSLTLLSPDDAENTARWKAYGLVAAAVVASLLVGAVIALITARRLVSPLSDLTQRAARLGAGDFRTSSRRFGIAELDRVAEVLDASALQVAALLQGERELAADVSHQLRTRLTGIQLRLDELADHPDPAVRAEIEPALQQTDRLVGVVNDLLANARSRRAASAATLDLDAELVEINASWRDAFASARRRLVITGGQGLRVRATPVRLREAVGVLLDNALSHGAGTVALRVEERPQQGLVLIEVTDEGPGITDAVVPARFRPRLLRGVLIRAGARAGQGFHRSGRRAARVAPAATGHLRGVPGRGIGGRQNGQLW